jgi:hypothetical protein
VVHFDLHAFWCWNCRWSQYSCGINIKHNRFLQSLRGFFQINYTISVITPSEMIPYYRLNHSIWSLSDNKKSAH